jgi:tripartite-type tricarboxylate transporter receptor subunit TctC
MHSRGEFEASRPQNKRGPRSARNQRTTIRTGETVMTLSRGVGAVAAAVVAALAGFYPARAAEPFAGQTVYVSSSTDPGGGFDLYVRLLTRHIGRHIAGNPTVVPQNRPGGGGLVLANFLYNAASKDGTQVGLIPAYVLLEQRFKNPQAKFDPSKFVWIGNMNQEVDHCSVWHTTGISKP